MSSTAASVDKRAATIRDMFAGVAPRYDLLNHLLSGWLDQVWRRGAAAALELPEGSPIVDVCSGTGDQSIALARRGYRVTAADFCVPMTALARHKFARKGAGRAAGLAGDALVLPFSEGRFAGATVAFGLRNVADLDAALIELARVVRPGGRVALLDFALPRNRALRALYLFYFSRILPLIGRLVSPRGSAYAYLPASVLEFPQRRDFTERMEAAGLGSAQWRDLSLGVVCLYTGERAA